MEAANYKQVVLGLIFLKYVSDAFEARQQVLITLFRDVGNRDNIYAISREVALINEGHFGDRQVDCANCRCRTCRLVPAPVHAAAEPTTYRFCLARETATLIMFGGLAAH